MMNKKLKTLLLASTLSLPASAMADWPVAIVDNVTVHAAQTSITIDPLENDIGIDLEIPEVNSWSENGARITKSLYSLSYSPPANFSGEDGFWYVIKDSQGRTNAARVSVNVLPSNSTLPAPQEDFVKTPKDTAIRINVLKNDLFSTSTLTGRATGDGLIAYFGERSEKGGKVERFTAYPDGVETFKYHLLYTPPEGFTGTDTFWYSARDNESWLTGTSDKWVKVTIEVSADNAIKDPYPTAEPDTSISTCFRVCTEPLNFVLRNDTGNNLILKLSSTWSLNGGRASAHPQRSAGGASLKYTPKEGFFGEDKVWYLIEDEFGRQTWSVLTINVIETP